MNKKDKDMIKAGLLGAVWMIGILLIGELTETAGKNYKGAFLIVIWTLAVILYAVLHDYIENLRSSVHERVKAVYAAEMRFIREREAFYKQRDEGNV